MKNNISKFISENSQRIKNERIQEVVEALIEMEEQAPKKYYLDITTIETLNDVKSILAGLNLAIYNNDPNFPIYKKYFRIEEE